jgi:CheY-like chemotaxis protein/AraC-like DNA-binding protein
MATVLAPRPVILVVDDDDGVREALCLDLGSDYEVMTSASGEAGLLEIGRRRVDLVLLDLLMVGLDGLAVLERLRQTPGRRPRVMILSGIDRSAPAVEAIRRGADGWVVKPWDDSELLRQCRNLLTRRIIVHGGEPGIRACIGAVVVERCGSNVTLQARPPESSSLIDVDAIDAAVGDTESGLTAVLTRGPISLVGLSLVVTRVLHRVGRHLSDATVATLASGVGLTAKHLSERFRREIGLGLHDFITRARVEAVKERLSMPDCPPLERWVAEVGFCDGSHLWKVFTRYEPHPPGRYRRNIQDGR